MLSMLPRARPPFCWPSLFLTSIMSTTPEQEVTLTWLEAGTAQFVCVRVQKNRNISVTLQHCQELFLECLHSIRHISVTVLFEARRQFDKMLTDKSLTSHESVIPEFIYRFSIVENPWGYYRALQLLCHL